MPEVSVIIPTFNYGRFLEQAIQSVLGQTFQDFELIVVDDGSTDDTREVLARFESDRRVRCLFQANRGDAAARNTGILNAGGRYVAFLDSDDYWMPEKLERQLGIMRSDPTACAVHSAVYIDHVDGAQRQVSRHILRRRPLRENSVYEQLLYEQVITGSNSSVLLTRGVLNEVRLYDEGLKGCCDIDLWQRIARDHEFHYVDLPLTCLRKHASNSSGDLSLMSEYQERYLKKLDRDVPHSFRYHLPRARAAAYLSLAWQFARRWQWVSACFYAARVFPSVVRCPLFTARFLGRKLAERFQARFAESTECLAETPRSDPPSPRIQCSGIR